MNKKDLNINDLYTKRELLLAELKVVEKKIELENKKDDDCLEIGGLELLNRINEVRLEFASLNNDIELDVISKKNSMSENEWFAYMGHAERKKELNVYRCDERILQLKIEAVNLAIANGAGDIRQLQSLMHGFRVDLDLDQALIKRISYCVESSEYYYQVVAGNMKRLDYETWLFGNKKVPFGEDAEFVEKWKKIYKNGFQTSANDEESYKIGHR